MVTEETRAGRLKEIHEAAYAIVAKRGYGATSMLTIAKEARASNETMYRWFGDKKGLFKSMVEANAAEARGVLSAALADGGDPMDAIRSAAPVLLAMLLGDRAIALNRAAAADATGELGEAISTSGRETIQPMIVGLMARALEARLIAVPSSEIAAEWFLALLIGDQQIRRVIGRMPEPGKRQIAERVSLSLAAFENIVVRR